MGCLLGAPFFFPVLQQERLHAQMMSHSGFRAPHKVLSALWLPTGFPNNWAHAVVVANRGLLTRHNHLSSWLSHAVRLLVS